MESSSFFMSVIAPYINFFIFFFLAIKFFKKPLGNMISGRKETYENLLRLAQASKEEALAQQKQLDRRLSDFDQHLASIANESRKSAEAEAEAIVEQAREMAQRIEQEANRLTEAKVKAAREMLRKDILLSVTEAVTQRLKTELDEKAHNEVVGNKIKSLAHYREEA